MKKQILQLLALSALLLGTACELETVEYGKIDPSTFPKSKEDADALVISAAYHPFNTWNMFNTGWGYPMLSFMQTDEMECSWPACYIGFDMTGAGGYPVTDESRTPLYYHSKYLSGMMLAIDRIKDVPMTDTERAGLNAELRCGMGFLAFMLYDLYGPISLPNLEALKDPLSDAKIPRATETEMQAFIESNLLAAAPDLPYKYDESGYGRFTKGCANMVLLKYYMMARCWKDAVRIGRELTKKDYGYELVPDYHSLFTLAGEKNTEVIFSATAKNGYGMTHSWLAHTLPSDFPVPAGLNLMQWGVFHLSWPFYDTFEAGDRRLEKIYAEYTGTTGTVHSRADRSNADRTGLYYGPVPLKYGLEGTIGQECEIDIPVYRYADAITLLAEAIVRDSEVVTDEALEYLNQVRRRVGLAEYTMGQVPTVAKFLEVLLAERGHELYMEGARRQDLIRHGKFIQVNEAKMRFAGVLTDARLQKIYQKTDGFRYDYERLPIPIGIVNQGGGVILQNPGY